MVNTSIFDGENLDFSQGVSASPSPPLGADVPCAERRCASWGAGPPPPRSGAWCAAGPRGCHPLTSLEKVLVLLGFSMLHDDVDPTCAKSRVFSGMIDNNYNHSILPFPSIPYVKRTRKSLACHNLAHPQGPNGAMSFYCGEIQGAVAMWHAAGGWKAMILGSRVPTSPASWQRSVPFWDGDFAGQDGDGSKPWYLVNPKS